jgi:hypothetical protein
MYRKTLLWVASAIASLLSLDVQAQVYEQRCVNGKCTWVLVQPAPAAPAATVQAARPRVTFAKALMQVSEEAYKDGVKAAAEGRPLSANQISRLELMRIRLICMRPAKVKELESLVADQMVTDGHVTGISSIDWNAWLEVIRELIPIILKIIDML